MKTTEYVNEGNDGPVCHGIKYSVEWGGGSLAVVYYDINQIIHKQHVSLMYRSQHLEIIHFCLSSQNEFRICNLNFII